MAQVLAEERARKKAVEAAQARVQLIQGMAGQLASGVSRAFMGMFSGAKNAFDAIGQAFESMIEQMLEKLITSGILTLLGSLIGGPIGGAIAKNAWSWLGFDVGSWSVPSTMPAMVHKGEIIIPPGASDKIRRGEASIGGFGGGRSVNVTLNVQALDGPSVYRVLTDNQSQVVRVLREAVADGRM